MNRADQKEFIEKLCDSVRDNLISKLEKIPENWDGIELRELTAEKFRQEAYFFKDKRNARYKEYKNTVIIKNL